MTSLNIFLAQIGAFGARTISLHAIHDHSSKSDIFKLTHYQVLAFVDRHALHGLGIGYFDAHLLTAAQLTPGTEFWTRDRRLNEAAKRLGLALRHH